MNKFQKSLIVIAFAVLALAASGIATAAKTTSSTRLATLDSTLLTQINVVRKSHGLTPLTASRPLAVAADKHTLSMGEAGFFSHDSLDRTVSWKRIERSYPSAGHRSWTVGENLLYVTPDVDAAQAVKLWMSSPGHRANILDPSYREIGVATRHFASASGVYGGQEVTILTTDFGART